jgi:hypothetical protein
MKVVLYLFLANFGWIEFEAYESFEVCNTTREHILEGNPSLQIETLCCALDESSCNTQEQEMSLGSNNSRL